MWYVHCVVITWVVKAMWWEPTWKVICVKTYSININVYLFPIMINTIQGLWCLVLFQTYLIFVSLRIMVLKTYLFHYLKLSDLSLFWLRFIGHWHWFFWQWLLWWWCLVILKIKRCEEPLWKTERRLVVWMQAFKIP